MFPRGWDRRVDLVGGSVWGLELFTDRDERGGKEGNMKSMDKKGLGARNWEYSVYGRWGIENRDFNDNCSRPSTGLCKC